MTERKTTRTATGMAATKAIDSHGTLSPERVKSGAPAAPRRVPLTAREKHLVAKRDGDQCTFRDVQGARCVNMWPNSRASIYLQLIRK